jgi:hypothetical protein
VVSSITFPDWVSDPEVSVLLVPKGTHEEGFENLMLVNAVTNERFDLPNFGSIAYFWTLDGQSIGLLSSDKSTITLINITTGIITLYYVDERASRFFYSDSSKYGPEGSIPTGEIDSPNFTLVWRTAESIYDGRIVDYGRYLFNIETEEYIELGDPENDIWVVDVDWSPNPPFLGVSYSDKEGTWFYDFYEGMSAFWLEIINFETGEVVKTYENITFPNWSPDGTKFLYAKVSEYLRESPPCIFDMYSETSICYPIVTNDHPIIGDYDQYLFKLEWSPDQTMVSYGYWIYNRLETEAGMEERQYGGLCLIKVANGSIRCMLGSFDEEHRYMFNNYRWSPDSNYVSFSYSTMGYYSDDYVYPQLGIADVRTGKYFEIGDGIESDGLGLWRP